MKTPRPAQVHAQTFEVACPYCGNAQPNVDDGSFLHDARQLATRPSRSTCVDCDAEFAFVIPSTARIDRQELAGIVREEQRNRRRRRSRPAPTTTTVDADGVKIYVERESSRCWVAWVDEDDARAVGLERLVGTEYEGPTQREAVASAVSEVLANRTDNATGFRPKGIRT